MLNSIRSIYNSLKWHMKCVIYKLIVYMRICSELSHYNISAFELPFHSFIIYSSFSTFASIFFHCFYFLSVSILCVRRFFYTHYYDSGSTFYPNTEFFIHFIVASHPDANHIYAHIKYFVVAIYASILFIYSVRSWY